MIDDESKIICFLRRFRLRFRIAAFLLMFMFIFSIIILMATNIYSEFLIRNYIYKYVESTQAEIASSISFIIDEMTVVMERIIMNEDIYRIIKDDSISYEKKRDEIENILEGMVTHRGVIGNIIIVSTDNQEYGLDYDNTISQIPEDSYFRQIDEASDRVVWGQIRKDGENNSFIPLGMKYRDMYSPNAEIGYLIVYIRESALLVMYKEIISKWGHSFIISKDEYVISHPDKKKIGEVIFDSGIFKSDKVFDYKAIKFEGENTIIATYRVDERLRRLGADLKIVSVIKKDRLFEIIDTVNGYIFWIGIVMSLISLFPTFYIAKKITSPVTLLKNKQNIFGRGDFEVSLFSRSGDEIWELEKSFNEMVVRIRELIRKNSEEKEKQREMELIALQAQINPHFLYNTLDAIGWIAKIEKQYNIEQLVMALASFFRLSLHKGEKFITVEEEIQLIKSFVVIEQMRFPDKFEIIYNIEKEIRQFKILKIILQPLVENAIKHGINRKKGKGVILVNGCKVENRLRFEVIDDGVGFDVDNMNSDEKKSNKLNHGGYGLKNVNQRIKLEYGEECGLNIQSEVGMGTRVEVTVNYK